MTDRFGLPAPAKELFGVTRLKLRAAPLGVKRVDLGPKGGRIVLHPEAKVDPVSVVRLVQNQPARYRFEGNERLRITASARGRTAHRGPACALRSARGAG